MSFLWMTKRLMAPLAFDGVGTGKFNVLQQVGLPHVMKQFSTLCDFWMFIYRTEKPVYDYLNLEPYLFTYKDKALFCIALKFISFQNSTMHDLPFYGKSHHQWKYSCFWVTGLYIVITHTSTCIISPLVFDITMPKHLHTEIQMGYKLLSLFLYYNYYIILIMCRNTY